MKYKTNCFDGSFILFTDQCDTRLLDFMIIVNTFMPVQNRNLNMRFMFLQISRVETPIQQEGIIGVEIQFFTCA